MHRLYYHSDDVELIGAGRAFEESLLVLPRQHLALDGGWGAAAVFAQSNLFVSHLHMDHALGLPRYVVNRQKMGDGRARVIVGPRVAPHAKAIVAAWQQAEGRADPVEWLIPSPGERVPLEPGLAVELFEAPHTIPAYGLVLYRRRKVVRPAFRELPPDEIGRLVRAGEDPVETVWDPIFAYTGDTGIDVFDAVPVLRRAHVLVTECTFVDALHAEGAPRVRGHIHWEELCAQAQHFENERIVLTHFSKRYAAAVLCRHLNATVPEVLRPRLRPWIAVTGDAGRSD